MTEDDKKKLTEWMGEKLLVGLVGQPYVHKGEILSNRNFSTDADMLALFRKLVEKVLWGKFWELADKAWNKDDTTYIETYEQYDEQAIIRWLFLDPERFCSLVAEFKPWEK